MRRSLPGGASKTSALVAHQDHGHLASPDDGTSGLLEHLNIAAGVPIPQRHEALPIELQRDRRASFVLRVISAGLRYRPSDRCDLGKELLNGRLLALPRLNLGQFTISVGPDVIAPRDEGLSLCCPLRLC